MRVSECRFAWAIFVFLIFTVQAAAQTAKPSTDNLFAEGYSLLEAGDAQAAAAKFEAGLKTSPQNPLAHFFLGKAYYTLEKYDLAKTHLSKSLDLDPTNKYAADARALLQTMAQADAQVAAENSLWASAQSSKNKSYYQSYLQLYPKGKHVSEAQDALASITKDEARKAAEAAAQAEEAAWASAQQGGRGGARAYLQQYPNGRYVAAAKARLAVPAIVPKMIAIPSRNFEMSKYLVTQAEWGSVMDVNPSEHKGSDLPVDNLGWNDIQSYLAALAAITGKQYRLPTNAELEYACQGGKNHKYCGSDDVDAVAWYAGNSGGTIHPVGQKQPNGYGLYDMTGNLAEWTSGCVRWAALSRVDCSNHYIDGGSWSSDLKHLSMSHGSLWGFSLRTGGDSPEPSAGIRLARTLP